MFTIFVALYSICIVGDNFIKIWDVLSGGRLLMALNSHHKTVTSLCFCMNYKRLVSASLDRLVTGYGILFYESELLQRFCQFCNAVIMCPKNSCTIFNSSSSCL